MAASRLPPAQPGAPSVGQSGQGRGQAKDHTPAGGAVVPPPGPRKTRAYGPPALPPPLRPVSAPPLPIAPPLSALAHPPIVQAGGRSFGQDDESDEQTTVDPQIFKDPQGGFRDSRELGVDVDIDQKSTTTEAMTADSNDLMLEPSVDVAAEAFEPGGGGADPDDHLASGTGETGGASVDEPTHDEAAYPAPALGAVVREPPRGPAAARPGPRMPSAGDVELSPAWLVVQSGTDRGRRFALRNGRTSIGRGVDNDVVLTDIAVSRRHLIIEFDGVQYVMNDLGSGNGTLVNDRDEDGSFSLNHGDKMELGNTVLVFECTAVGLPQALGKWHPHGGDEDLSTVAGHRAGNPGAAQSPPPFLRAPTQAPDSVPPPVPRPGAPRQGLTAPLQGRSPPSRPAPTRPPALGPSPARGPGPSSPSMAGPGGRVPSHAPPVRTGRTANMAAQQPRPMSGEGPMAPLGGGPSAPSLGAFASYQKATLGGMGAVGGSGLRNAISPSSMGYPPMPPMPSMPGGYSMSPSPASSPRFQYPNGVMAPMPSAERRRVLISILAIAFVAVGAGIVMALVHGGSEEQVATATRKPPAGAAPTAGAPTATPTPTAAPLPEQPAGTAVASAGTGAAAPDLRGSRELRPVDFGTDEQFLAEVSSPAGGGASAAREKPVDGASESAAGEETAGTGKGTSGAGKETSGGEEVATADRGSRREGRHHGRTTDETETADDGESSAPELPSLDDTEGGGGSGSADVALRQAEALYRQKRFADAAALLRRSADTSGKRDVGRLRALAVNYAKIGSLLDEGQESLVSDAPRALQAFKSALRLDEEFGDSVHDRTIGARIAQVAPAAAGAYMARKDYPEAKSAADIAEKFGAGDSDRVRIVRSSLERKAEELYEEAKGQAEGGDASRAAETARLILRMVPRSSDIYAQASKLAGN
ncbi:MAG TPA: FHA domain-containing protein [Kofleriaceae bacterium]|nr:FHA domain-containing protein [Kofleriaceae bacterium]